MSPLSDYLNLLIDPFMAALASLNLWPTLILGLILGLIPTSKPKLGLKALGVALLAVIAQALWPLYYGLEPVMVDPLTMVFYIHLLISMATAYFILGCLRLMLLRLPLGSKPAHSASWTRDHRA